MKVLLTGGGTGGHIYPLLAVAKEIKKIGAQYKLEIDLHYMGPIDQHSIVLRDAGIKMHSIMTGKIRRYFSLLNIIDIPKIFIGLTQTFFKMLFLMPDVIFSKGGPGGFQVVFAGWFYRIPAVIHESDSIPGLTNLLSSRFSKRIGISFDSAGKYFNPGKLFLSGNPVRRDLVESKSEQNVAKAELGFHENKPLIFISGGSQGSKRINEFIVSLLPQLLEISQVIHQTGIANFDEVKKLSTAVRIEDVSLKSEIESRYEVLPYLDTKKMALVLSAADVVVARAGSGTIFETSAFGKPVILIPLAESANDHQKENAYAYSEAGAALVIEESNLKEQIFLSQVRKLLGSPDELARMSRHASKFFQPEAPVKIAEEVIALAV